MNQKIEALSADDQKQTEKQRNWVRGHYSLETQNTYDTIEGKLSLLETILQENWIEPNETWKLQCQCITFGDALAQKLNLHWAAVEDEYGRDPALHDQGTTIVLFPTTSISKRIDKGTPCAAGSAFAERITERAKIMVAIARIMRASHNPSSMTSPQNGYTVLCRMIAGERSKVVAAARQPSKGALV